VKVPERVVKLVGPMTGRPVVDGAIGESVDAAVDAFTAAPAAAGAAPDGAVTAMSHNPSDAAPSPRQPDPRGRCRDPPRPTEEALDAESTMTVL